MSLRTSFSTFLLFILSLHHCQSVLAYAGFDFGWEGSVSSLKQCQTLNMTLDSGSSVPPYTILWLPLGGLPKLEVTPEIAGHVTVVDYPVGTQLTMNIFDSQETSGGGLKVYTVQQSNDTSCLPEVSKTGTNVTKSPLSMTINTTSLDACDTLGIGFYDGTPPYSLSLSLLGGPEYHNISIGTGNHGYNYVNWFAVNQSFVVAGADR